MAGTYLNFPFDEELFLYNWENQKDPVLTAMLDCGAIRQDAQIAGLIANGSSVYTLPYYNKLAGNEVNLDGATNITADLSTGDSQTGFVIGRAKGWTAKDFVGYFNSGADPVAQILSRVGAYTSQRKQDRLIYLLNGLFGITGNADWSLHTTNLATSTSSVSDSNKIAVSSAVDAMQKALGDNKNAFSLIIMHSIVAARLEKLQLLEYWKYTDANGVQRPMNIANYNGLTVIVDDSCPVGDSGTASGAKEYTSYLFGEGALGTAPAPVDKPVEIERSAATNGGQDTLYTRYRYTLHPYGFSYNIDDGSVQSKISPTDADIALSSAWSMKFLHKNIPIARLITNG